MSSIENQYRLSLDKRDGTISLKIPDAQSKEVHRIPEMQSNPIYQFIRDLINKDIVQARTSPRGEISFDPNPNLESRIELTLNQKLQALSLKYYSYLLWTPKKGDYYTSARADLELYRIVDIIDGKVYTEYCHSPGNVSEWTESGFTSEGFGIQRVWVPEHIFKHFT